MPEMSKLEITRGSSSWAAILFATAFFVRGIAAIVTTLTTLNPDSTGDAVGFGNSAEMIARGLLTGRPFQYVSGSIDFAHLLFPSNSVDIYTLWGTFLSPFWLFPGPSGLYARLGNAFLGAFAIYNVYIIARYYHSHHAGVVASLPMVFYPSIVAVHSTLLREAIVLFGITTAARFLLISSERMSRLRSLALGAIALHVSLLMRADNLVIFVAAVASALLVYAIETRILGRRAIKVGVSLAPIAFILSLPVFRRGVRYLAHVREIRARGRAVYLPEVVPHTILELVAFSWVGAAYFLYAPFPWMIETVPDLLVGIEGLISITFTIAAVWGVRAFGQKNAAATVGLLVGLAVAVVLYGIGTVNYGTGARHRQMFLWVIFLFGGVGISEHVRFVWPFEWENVASTDTKSPKSNSD